MKAPTGRSEITYVTTYYNEPKLLWELLESFDNDTFSKIVIVDDGSKIHPAEPIVRMFSDLPITLLRIKEDLGFNSHGARNLGMKHVDTEWAIITDIDMYFDAGICNRISQVTQTAPPNMYFNFWISHKQDFIGRCEMSHNDICIRPSEFWVSGGYDEEFVGRHWGDRQLMDRVNSYLTRATIPNILIDRRLARKCIMTDDVSITTYTDAVLYHPRMPKKEMAKITELVGKRNENRELWVRDSIINYEWEQVI